jgi:hypothetical protein
MSRILLRYFLLFIISLTTQAGITPETSVWYKKDLPEDWVFPAYTGWTDNKFSVLVNTQGELPGSLSQQQILARIGAISKQQDITYWSSTKNKWRSLISRSVALKDSSREHQRQDFSPQEFKLAHDFYYWQEHNTPAVDILYAMNFSEISNDKIAFNLTNMNKIHWLSLPVISKQRYQQAFLIQRNHQENWEYRHLLRVYSPLAKLVVGNKESLIHREKAIHRYMAE